MQGGKNWILLKEINANRSSETLIGWKSGIKPLISIHGIKWRESGNGLWMRRSERRLLDEECLYCCCLYINIKKVEECVREETAYLAPLKSKSI